MTPSPCTKVCEIDAATGWCRGCGRTAEEIGDWPYAETTERRAVLARLPSRLRLLQRSASRR